MRRECVPFVPASGQANPAEVGGRFKAALGTMDSGCHDDDFLL